MTSSFPCSLELGSITVWQTTSKYSKMGRKRKKNQKKLCAQKHKPRMQWLPTQPKRVPNTAKMTKIPSDLRAQANTAVVFRVSTVSFMEGFSEWIGLTSARNYLGGAGPALGPWMDDSVSPGSSQPDFSDYFSEETPCRAKERTPGWKQMGHLSWYPSLKLG